MPLQLDVIFELANGIIMLLMVAVVNGKIYLMGGSSFCDGWNLPCQTVLSLVEEYTPDNQKFSVNSQDKLSSTWGNIKSIR